MTPKQCIRIASSTVAALLVSVGLARPARAATPPKSDHIIIVFEENKDYGQVIGSSNAPYINNTLLAKGYTFKGYAKDLPTFGNAGTRPASGLHP